MQAVNTNWKPINRITTPLAGTPSYIKSGIIKAVTSGVDIVSHSGHIFVDAATRASMVPIVVAQRIFNRREQLTNRRDGIEQARREGKYTGRKPIVVDENTLRQVAKELEEGLITVKEAMQRTGVSSRSTFYRKLRGLQ